MASGNVARRLLGFLRQPNLQVWCAATLCICCLGNNAIAQNLDSQRVSLIAVIATPGRFHGATVDVTGWASIQWESQSLCLTRDALSASDCIWIDHEFMSSPDEPVSVRARREKLRAQTHHQVITVRGTFNAKHGGHLGMWSGAIENIRSITVHDRKHGPIVIDLTR
jgi:hypothetical protein